MNNQQFESLDMLTILSFIAQLQNMKQDTEEKRYIHLIIQQIGNEIERLHKENDRIEMKINQILLKIGEINTNDIDKKTNGRS